MDVIPDLKVVEVLPTGISHTATVIFLHGTGNTGSFLKNWITYLLGKTLSFKHIKMIYPTAPFQAHGLLNGKKSHVWFSRNEFSINAEENLEVLIPIYKAVNNLIDKEVKSGIPLNRIIIIGYSMGGELALHLAYHANRKIAGVIACSTILYNNSIVYKSIKERFYDCPMPELLMFYGDKDQIVYPSWTKKTFNNLKNLGVPGICVTLKNTDHEITLGEILQIIDWINCKLPPLEENVVSKL